MKGYRSIHIDGEEWNWRAGKQFLTVKSPKGERRNFPLTEVLGMNWVGIEDDKPPVTPAIVKAKLTLWKDEFEGYD